MTHSLHSRVAFTLGVLLVLIVAPAAVEAKEATSAAEAAEAVRKALPEPTPAISLDYEGDIVQKNLWMGEFTLTVRAAKVGRQTVWRVTQEVFMDLGVQGETRGITKLHLARDLSILSGSAEMSGKGTKVTFVFSRVEKGLRVQRRAKLGDDWQPAESFDLAAPKGASGGLGAMLLFLRAVPNKKDAAYALPWVGKDLWPLATVPAANPPLVLKVNGEGSFGTGPKKRLCWTATSSQGDVVASQLHLSRDRHKLLGIIGSEHSKERIVPRGEGGTRDVDVDEGQPAKTWKDAFLKFGYGYHMAKPKLIEAAFHWDRMYEHETKVKKRWPAERPLADFKQAWVDEFIANSKHRTLADTKRLLAMTLSTGKVRTQTTTHVVFDAHPNFGGGVKRTYHLEKRDKAWGIVRIDF